MKKINSIIVFFIGINIYCCTPRESINTEKKLVQIVGRYYGDPRIEREGDTGNILTSVKIENILYDNIGNVIQIKDENGLVSKSYTYDLSNRLIKVEYNQYESEYLSGNYIDSLSYNSYNKISSIKRSTTYYDFFGNNFPQTTIENYNITYENGSIIKTPVETWNPKIEYGLTNDLITSLRIYQNNSLKEEMTFSYDSEGNCISGTTSVSNYANVDRDFNVSYGTQIKNQIFNMFFDYLIFTQSRAWHIRRVLLNTQGTKYPEIIKNSSINETAQDTYENSFVDGYITSKTLSWVSGILFTENYTWE